MAIVAYLCNGKEILSIWFITTVMFIISVGTVIANMQYFKTDISVITFAVILISLFSIGIGEMIAMSMIYSNQRQHRIGGQSEHFNSDSLVFENIRDAGNPIIIKASTIVLISIFIFSIAFIQFYKLYKFSLTLGNPGLPFLTAAYTRNAILNGEYSGGRLLGWASTFSGCVAYFFTYLFFMNRYIYCFKNYLYLLPMGAYFFTCFSSTARTGFIQIIAVFLVIMLVFKKADCDWSWRNNRTIIKDAMIALVAFFVIFGFLGQMGAKQSEIYDWRYKIPIYSGASIIGFDYFLTHPKSSNMLFGQETLKWFYEILNSELGFRFQYENFKPFFSWGYGESNIYSALRDPIQDYGILPSFILQCLIGFFYGLWIQKIKSIKNWIDKSTYLIMFALFMYPIFMYSIANVFSSILKMATIMQFVFLYLLKRYFITLPSNKCLLQSHELANQDVCNRNLK